MRSREQGWHFQAAGDASPRVSCAECNFLPDPKPYLFALPLKTPVDAVRRISSRGAHPWSCEQG